MSGCLDSREGIKIRRTRHNVTYTDFDGRSKSVLHMTVCLPSTTLTCVTRLMVGENRPGLYQQPACLSAESCRNAVGTVVLGWSNMCCSCGAEFVVRNPVRNVPDSG